MKFSAFLRSLPALLPVLLPVILNGCSGSDRPVRPMSYEEAANSELIAANYKAANALITQARLSLAIDQPVIIATVVNINQLETSSAFGRLISEHISAKFSQSGFKMIEMKARKNVYMKRNEGELLLTREIKDIAAEHNAQAVVVGLYAVSTDVVFVNVKVLHPSGNQVLAAYDYAVPLDNNNRALLQTAGKH